MHCVVKTLLAIAIRTFCCIFCRKSKDWYDPELMALEKFHSFLVVVFSIFISRWLLFK